MKHSLLLSAALCLGLLAAHAGDPKIAAEAVNAFGVDLYRAHIGGEDNLLFSPYSIQTALAMTYAGAEGETRAEMQHALHYPANDDALHGGFSALARALAEATAKSIKDVRDAKVNGGPSTPHKFVVANRLFAQRTRDFRAPFLSVLKNSYAAPLEEVDYRQDPEKARTQINRWVSDQTMNRIHDVLPAGTISAKTRLTLVNAFYLRAPWEEQFHAPATLNESFLVRGREAAEVPTMRNSLFGGYARREGFQIVTLYSYSHMLQLVILLPDRSDGLAALERELTAQLVADCAHLPLRALVLELPKFRLEPASQPLDSILKGLGVKRAFNDPPGSADFGRMAPRQAETPLAIDFMMHQSFLAIDEKGIEAAAATVKWVSVGIEPDQVKIHVDHPFVFAVQHVESGACLFLGRVTDPR